MRRDLPINMTAFNKTTAINQSQHKILANEQLGG